jgi:putative DNA primase/helicase
MSHSATTQSALQSRAPKNGPQSNGAAPHKPAPQVLAAPKPDEYTPQIIALADALAGFAFHATTGDDDRYEHISKGKTPKGKPLDLLKKLQEFDKPTAAILEALKWCHENPQSGFDYPAVAARLSDIGKTKAAQVLDSAIYSKIARETNFLDCVETILNYKGTPEFKAAQAAEQLAADFPLDEIGNGRRFAAANRYDMRFCGVREKWLVFKDGRWMPDESGAAEQRAKAVGQQIAAEAAAQPDDDKRARLLKHALTLTKRVTRETMLKDAASEDGMRTTPEQFDCDPHLFNCANGTLNLKTFEFRPHAAADLLTLQSPVVYDPNATCPTWRACMARWMPDEATREYDQDCAGISLSGEIFEEFFNFIFGEGDNGKSSKIRVMERIFGSYWHKTQAETIMQARDRRQPNAPSPELLALKGARLVTVHEIDSKHQINAPLIKDLTGRDAITARGLFEKRPTTFEPQFTLWMFGNSKPQIKDTSGGMWRRVRLIDFGQPIPPHERDPQLNQKLRAELSGILNWMLEGLRRVYERGLLVPDTVKTATNGYRAEQDAMSGFIADCCVIAANCTASAADLWAAWCQWCGDNGERQGTQTALGLELKRRKFENFTSGGKKKWSGIGLKRPENEPDEPKKAQNEPKKPEKVEGVDSREGFPEKVRTENTICEGFSGKLSKPSTPSTFEESAVLD